MGFTRVSITSVCSEVPGVFEPKDGLVVTWPLVPATLTVRGRCSLVFVSQEAEHFYFLFYLFPDSWLSLMDCLSACA